MISEKCDVVNTKTHLIDKTMREGISGVCGHRGFPVDTMGELAEFIICKPVKGRDTLYTHIEELVTCGNCLRAIIRRKANGH